MLGLLQIDYIGKIVQKQVVIYGGICLKWCFCLVMYKNQPNNDNRPIQNNPNDKKSTPIKATIYNNYTINPLQEESRSYSRTAKKSEWSNTTALFQLKKERHNGVGLSFALLSVLFVKFKIQPPIHKITIHSTKTTNNCTKLKAP